MALEKILALLEAAVRPEIVVYRATDALLAVDATKTFMPGGGLPVMGGNEIVSVIRNLVEPPRHLSDPELLFDRERRIATIDRHPWGHVSYAESFIGAKGYDLLVAVDTVLRGPRKRRVKVSIAPHAKFSKRELAAYLKKVGSQMLWPTHGLAGTDEAELHHELRDPSNFGYLLMKGLDSCCDSYSAFKDNRGRLTELADIGHARGIKRWFGCGLAEDFCLGWSLLDAVELGFEAVLLQNATRPVNIPGTKKKPGSLETIRRRFKEAGVVIAHTTDLVAA